MIDILLDYFSTVEPLSDEEIKAIHENTVVKIYKKGINLLNESDISKECFFIQKGLIRQYHIKNGAEITTNFYTEKECILSAGSFIKDIPTNHNLDTLEETTAVVGNKEREKKLYTKFPRLELISKNIMEKGFGIQQDRMALYFSSTPVERYLSLLESRPQLIQRISEDLLASYIGVKPASLSRIRNLIESQKK